jgi:hypothetical protein
MLFKAWKIQIMIVFKQAKLVSIQKWPFSAISASICGITCSRIGAAVFLDFLDLAKNGIKAPNQYMAIFLFKNPKE